MKKTLLIILLSVVSLGILTCAYILIDPFSLITNTSVMDQNPASLPVFSVQNAETDEEISLSLLDQYLDHYTKHGLYNRLLAYKCDSVQIEDPQAPVNLLFLPVFLCGRCTANAVHSGAPETV